MGLSSSRALVAFLIIVCGITCKAEAGCPDAFARLFHGFTRKVSLQPVVKLDEAEMKLLRELRVENLRWVSQSEAFQRREFPKTLDVLGVSYEIQEKLGAGTQGHVFAAVDPEGKRVSLKLYKEGGAWTHKDLVKAARSGIPSIVDESTSFDSKSSVGIYRFIHGITVRDVVNSKVDTTLKTKIVDGYSAWKERFCRDSKSTCAEYNVVFDFEESQFYLIDAY